MSKHGDGYNIGKEDKHMIDKLRGYKTFIAAGIMVIIAGLKAQGYIDEPTYQLLLPIAGALGLAALRLGMRK